MFYIRITGPNLQGVQLTSGVQFNQWRVFLVAQGSNRTRTRTTAVVPEIIT